MKLSAPSLLSFVREDHLRMSVNAALYAVGRYYCGPMQVKGNCTQNCVDCKVRIQEAFQLERADNAAALLTWRLKLEVAKAQEKPEVAYRPRQNAFGETIDENPFDVILKGL